MSNPVTNAEIEDVLSSIRRLVSDDARTLARSRPVTQPVEPERLVLTPALRVAPEPVTQSAPDTAPDTVSDTVRGPHPDPKPEAVPEEVSGAAPDRVAEDVEAPAGEADAHARSVDDETAAQQDVFEDADGADMSEPWSDPHATLYEVAAACEGAADGSVVEAHDDLDAGDAALAGHQVGGSGAEADGVGEHDVHPAGQDGEAVKEDAPHEGEVSPTEAASERTGSETSQNADAEAHKEPGLSGAVEVLSAAIVTTDEDWEPDGGWQPEGAETVALDLPHVETLDWQDADPQACAAPAGAATQGLAQGRQQTGETGAGPDDDQNDSELSFGDDLVMDEAMLREIVTDIVREELQGALGERITRNVRKLVRREINRALSVQDLE